ncbi:MAG: porin [Flavisolibacter sp.]|nr:porin [Flavisolibacter sp.]
MRRKRVYKYLITSSIVFSFFSTVFSQRFLTDYDSTLFIRDTLKPLVRRLENLHFSGYIQPQFQVAQQEGAPSYSGGNFSRFSNNRFMLRRARMRLDYVLPAKYKEFPKAIFAFQIDATERGVLVRDMFLRVYEPKRQNFSLVTGLFARPFGYEVNLSSGYRETPERGRASQILMPGERDLGAMVSYESQNPRRKAPLFKWDVGLFNGQSAASPTDFDSFKDIISRISLKPLSAGRIFTVSGGLSFLRGGWRQSSKYRYHISEHNGDVLFMVDSSISNVGDKVPRRYYGGDVQLIYRHAWGKTEGRAEYWRGTQPGTATTTTNPDTQPTSPIYIRNFDAAFFYFLQDIVNEKWELMVKYDWYDPNIKVAAAQIGKTGTNLTPADIRFNTLGIGFTHYFTGNLKILAYYEWVRNEKTNMMGFTDDIKDNVFTLRMQLRY